MIAFYILYQQRWLIGFIYIVITDYHQFQAKEALQSKYIGWIYLNDGPLWISINNNLSRFGNIFKTLRTTSI